VAENPAVAVPDWAAPASSSGEPKSMNAPPGTERRCWAVVIAARVTTIGTGAA
jgi:hypothetical protein